MDGATLSRFPHLAWINLPIPFRATGGVTALYARRVAHFICLNLEGTHEVRWITRGRETTWNMAAGAIQFGTADDEDHTVLARPATPCRRACIVIPRHHLQAYVESEGGGVGDPRGFILPHGDGILRNCLDRLLSLDLSGNAAVDLAGDESARQLILRITELSGGGTPDWHDDASVFDRRTLAHLVEHIDCHLKIPTSLHDMGLLTGLSPSHFARKFRQSTGLSLYRFLNRRRLLASMDMLKDESLSLAHVALELGFSSQAHFTHVFSKLTGITPAKYRKQSKPVVG